MTAGDIYKGLALLTVGILIVIVGTSLGNKTVENKPTRTAKNQYQPDNFADQPQPTEQLTQAMNTTPTGTGGDTDSQASTSAPAQATSSSAGSVRPHGATYVEVTQGCGPHFEGACLNVRARPSDDSPVVSRLRNGQVLRVDGLVHADNRLWYKITFDEWLRYPNRVSSEWYVAANFVKPVTAKPKSSEQPSAIASNKRIIVDLSDQTLTAYNQDEVFMQQAVSTGRPLYPTPQGKFPVFKKLPSRYMQGPIEGITDNYYDLPGVPWNLYFTYQGAVIHGAYWHNNFGQRWSHGCVNLPPEKAEKLYRWADLGTTVVVRD